MPGSGNEEPVIIAMQSSNSSAGIPIKKRKFTFICSPSPSHLEPSSPSAENDIILNKHSTLSQGISLSNACDLTNSPSESDASKNSVFAVKKETISACIADENMNTLSQLKNGIPADTNVNSVQNNANLARDKVQEPSHTTGSGFMDDVERKEKLKQDGKSLCPKRPGDTELHLAPNEASSLTSSWEALSKQQVERDCELERYTGLSNAMLSFEAKELLVPVLTGQNSEVTHPIHEKLDRSSSCLHLIEEKPLTQFKSSDFDSNDSGCHVHASRANWNLNTMMDACVGSLVDAPTRDTVGYDGLNETSGRPDRKTFINSSGMTGVGVETGKQGLGAGKNRSKFPSLSLPSSQQCTPEGSLCLNLRMSVCQSNFGEEHSGTSAKVDSGKICTNSNLNGGKDSSGNVNGVGRKAVKFEPLYDNAKNDCVRLGGDPMGLDFRTGKREIVDRNSKEAAKLQNISSRKLGAHRLIKSEPIQEVSQEIHGTIEVTSDHSVGNVVKSQDNRPPLSPLPTCSGLFTNGLSNQSGHSICTKEVNNKTCAAQGVRGSLGHTAAEMISVSVGHVLKESNISGDMIDSFRTDDLKVGIPGTSRAKMMEELPKGPHGNDEGSVVSDEEKISISADMLEDNSYGSDYESDGNHAFDDDDLDEEDIRSDKEDDEYEDGEVQEALVHSAVESLGDEVTEAENIIVGDYDAKNTDSLDFPGDSSTLQSHFDEKDSKTEDHVTKSEDHTQECVDNILSEKSDKDVDKDGCLHEQSCLTVEVTAAGADETRLMGIVGTKQIVLSGMKEIQQGHEKELSSDGASNASQGILTTDGQATDERVKEADMVGKSDSTLPKTKAPLNGSDAFKEVNSGGNRSRIINLSRGSNLTSPSKTITIPDRLLPSRRGKDRYSDFNGDHPRGHRDGYYTDNSHKFVRNRIHDQPCRNSRLNFVRGRGRGSSRLNSQRGEWDSDHDFAPDIYNGPGTGRGGRNPVALNDGLPSFHYSSSRKLSSGGRDGPATRSIHMFRRLPRNISPSRCTDVRHSKKFTRGLADDIIEPIFSHPQPPYEGFNDQSGRRNRNFSCGQRRGIPRFQSKSPIRSRTRSPGPWSSPRRRSPVGCTLLPELTQRRSPAIYRIERMRSPDRPCFREERVASRRRGSPPYMTRSSDDLRDISSGRDHGQLRSVIPNRRSPSKWVLPRGTRRLDIFNPRERVDGDYFGGPIRSGRFQELGGDGSADERRNLSERRGLVHSFRPPYNDAEGESFRFQLEDGPRPFRHCPEADPEFFERGSLREREFDRPFKTRPAFTPRRMRSGEEQEGNYRHSEQMWLGDGIDDISRAKRRRF